MFERQFLDKGLNLLIDVAFTTLVFQLRYRYRSMLYEYDSSTLSKFFPTKKREKLPNLSKSWKSSVRNVSRAKTLGIHVRLKKRSRSNLSELFIALLLIVPLTEILLLILPLAPLSYILRVSLRTIWKKKRSTLSRISEAHAAYVITTKTIVARRLCRGGVDISWESRCFVRQRDRDAQQ